MHRSAWMRFNWLDMKRPIAIMIENYYEMIVIRIMMIMTTIIAIVLAHDNVIQWKHFPRYWPVVWGIHPSTVNSPHKGQWRGALLFSLICTWIHGWVNNHAAGDLIRHCTHHDVIVMDFPHWTAVEVGDSMSYYVSYFYMIFHLSLIEKETSTMAY